MTVIKFEQDKHFEEINNWAKERGIEILPFLLSQNGFVTVDKEGNLLMAAWVYFVLDVPIVHIDNLISKPGMNMWKTRRAWSRLFSCIKDFLRIINEHKPMSVVVIQCIIGTKLVQEATREGFEIDLKPVTLCRYTV